MFGGRSCCLAKVKGYDGAVQDWCCTNSLSCGVIDTLLLDYYSCGPVMADKLSRCFKHEPFPVVTAFHSPSTLSVYRRLYRTGLSWKIDPLCTSLAHHELESFHAYLLV